MGEIFLYIGDAGRYDRILPQFLESSEVAFRTGQSEKGVG